MLYEFMSSVMDHLIITGFLTKASQSPFGVFMKIGMTRRRDGVSGSLKWAAYMRLNVAALLKM